MNYLIALLVLLVSFIPVSAQPPTIISGVINSYAKVTAIDYCTKTINVVSSAGFSIGDRAIIIQMQGATIDTTNSTNFGTITAIGEAGNFEFVTIESVTPTSIRLRYLLVQNYNPTGAVQLVKVPRYITAWVQGAPLTAPAWNGSTGGVLAFEASAAVDILSSIDVSGKGFRGGNTNPVSRGENDIYDYVSDITENHAGGKGEGIVLPFARQTAGRGAQANGGGGGNAHNSGGGGGGNGSSGGMGGAQYRSGASVLNGGVGGKSLEYIGGNPKIFMGGGGGGGHQNNNAATNGTAGGGIVIIKAGVLVGRGNTIFANGLEHITASRNDGAGGGGAGGSVVLDIERMASPVRIEAHGSRGGNNNNSDIHASGGGGSGGIIGVKNQNLLDSIIADLQGGNSGINIQFNDPWGAESGLPGKSRIGLTIPEGNVDPVVVQSSKDTTICLGGVAVIGRTAVGGRKPYKYSWSPSLGLDNSTSERPKASPSVSTFYTVTVTDSTGCTSQAQMWVNVYPTQNISASIDTAVCMGSSVQLQATGQGIFSWSPRNGLSDSTIPNPIASPTQTTVYTLTVTDSTGCTSYDSIVVKVNNLPTISIGEDDSLCEGNSLFLYNIEAKNGTPPYEYLWSPSIGISDIRTPAPVFSPLSTTQYKLTVIDSNGCTAFDTFTVKVNPLPIAEAGNSTSICFGDTTRLNGTTSAKITWSPSIGLSATNIPNPLAYPAQSTTYHLILENEFGCISTDSVRVAVFALPPKPILSLSADTVYSISTVPVSEFSWYRDGTYIPGELTSSIIATQSGSYTLGIKDSNGCIALSDPIIVYVGKATLSVEDACAYPGEIVEIPIRFSSAEMIGESLTEQFDMTLSFNASLLVPIMNGILENTVENGVRSIRLIAPFEQDSFPILTTLRFYAGLGNDTVTDVKLTKYTSIGGRVFLSDKVGRFCLKGVCTDGSVRLYRSGEFSAITSIIPQPIKENIAVEFVVGECGKSTLSLMNVLGQTVAILVEGQNSTGSQRLETNLAGYNSGVYFLVLQTPSERVVKMIEIHK
ncbi:MAG: T9SS type A sorting domain-containing protein [Ignavibacteria bacterium]|nr:T9SS type A sorting domain-containing protein [Ignavibacteria bacterium]